MKFKFVEENKIFDLTPTTALDEMVYGAVWQCLETDVKKVDSFFAELDELSVNDPVCYDLISPEFDEDDINIITDDIQGIANGRKFLFEQYEFKFLDELINSLEKQLAKYKKLQGR